MAKRVVHIVYHVAVVIMSAALAFSVPFVLNALAKGVLEAWSFIENEKILLVGLEIVTAVLLILFFNHIRRAWESRRIARMAKSAGLVRVTTATGRFARRRWGKTKRMLGFAREIMILGSTGYRTFVEPEGDLREALQTCREAKILLLNPFQEGAVTRARSIPDVEVTPRTIREQIARSIDFLKGLRAAQKEVRLKLYPETPLLKLAILGDFAFLRHYHTGMNVRQMPEYVFKNESTHGGLYIPLYRYFLARWQDPALPEYDLDRDELVYRDPQGNEVAREPLRKSEGGAVVDGIEAKDPGEAMNLKDSGTFTSRLPQDRAR